MMLPAIRFQHLACLAILFQTFFSSSDAQTRFWPDKGLAVCTEQGWQRNPRVVSDGKDGVIIVWEDIRVGSTTDLYAQHVDSKGKLLWNAKGIPICTAAGNQILGGIVTDGVGGAIIAWWDKRGADYDVYAQRVAPDSAVLWTKDGVVICNATKDQTVVKILSDGVGGAYLTWQDKRGTSFDIYAQRIVSTGSSLWQANGIVVCDEANDQTIPELISDKAGGCIMVWNDKRAEEDLYAQRLSPTGARLWNPTGAVATNEAGKQFGAKIAEHGDGGAFIVWQDLRSGTTTDIYYQILDRDGNKKFTGTSPPLAISDQAQNGLIAIPDGLKGAVCGWTDYRGSDPTTGDIYIMRVNENGDRVWTPASAERAIRLSSAVDAQENVSLMSDGAGGAFAVWQDKRNTYDFDLYMNRIDAAGQASFGGWTQDGSLLITEDHNQLNPQVIISGKGGAIIVWYDGRVMDGVADIYAQRVGISGWLTTNTNALDFGVIKLNDKAARSFIIRNDGQVPMTINGIRIVKITQSDASLAENDYKILTPFTTPFTMASHDSMKFDVEFSTAISKLREARIQILHDAPSSPFFITLSGTGTEPKIAVSPTQCAFGIVKANTFRDSTFTGWVTNPGNGILSITGLDIDGTNKDQFEIARPPAYPVLVPGGQSLSFTVRFKPTSDGYKTAKVKINNNTGTTKEINLSGSGAFPRFTGLQTRLQFDLVDVGFAKTKIFSMMNDGAVDLEFYGMKISGYDSTSFWVASSRQTMNAGDTSTVTVYFVPKRPGNLRSSLRISTDAPPSLEDSVQLLGPGGIPSAVEDTPTPNSIVLGQNYPNPFSAGSYGNPTTTIRFALAKREHITLKMFDVLGREVAIFVEEELNSGEHSVILDATGMPSGVYLYRLSVGSPSGQTPHFVLQKAMVLIK